MRSAWEHTRGTCREGNDGKSKTRGAQRNAGRTGTRPVANGRVRFRGPRDSRRDHHLARPRGARPIQRCGAGQGGPRISVDKDLIDFGTVPFRKFVEASFRVRNVGDQPLTLPANPPLDVLEGC